MKVYPSIAIAILLNPTGVGGQGIRGARALNPIVSSPLGSTAREENNGDTQTPWGNSYLHYSMEQREQMQKQMDHFNGLLENIWQGVPTAPSESPSVQPSTTPSESPSVQDPPLWEVLAEVMTCETLVEGGSIESCMCLKQNPDARYREFKLNHKTDDVPKLRAFYKNENSEVIEIPVGTTKSCHEHEDDAGGLGWHWHNYTGFVVDRRRTQVELFMNFTTTDERDVQIPMPLEVRYFPELLLNQEFEKYFSFEGAGFGYGECDNHHEEVPHEDVEGCPHLAWESDSSADYSRPWDSWTDSTDSTNSDSSGPHGPD